MNLSVTEILAKARKTRIGVVMDKKSTVLITSTKQPDSEQNTKQAINTQPKTEKQ